MVRLAQDATFPHGGRHHDFHASPRPWNVTAAYLIGAGWFSERRDSALDLARPLREAFH